MSAVVGVVPSHEQEQQHSINIIDRRRSLHSPLSIAIRHRQLLVTQLAALLLVSDSFTTIIQ